MVFSGFYLDSEKFVMLKRWLGRTPNALIDFDSSGGFHGSWRRTDIGIGPRNQLDHLHICFCFS